MDLRGCSKEPPASAALLGWSHSARTVRGERVDRCLRAGRLAVAGGAVGVPHSTGAGVASVAMGPGEGDGIDAVEKNTCQPPVFGAREWAESATLVGCIEGGSRRRGMVVLT